MGNHRKPPNSKAAVLVRRFARRAQTYRCACIISSFDRFEHAACLHAHFMPSHLLSSICWISLNIVEYRWISLNIVEYRWMVFSMCSLMFNVIVTFLLTFLGKSKVPQRSTEYQSPSSWSRPSLWLQRWLPSQLCLADCSTSSTRSAPVQPLPCEHRMV